MSDAGHTADKVQVQGMSRAQRMAGAETADAAQMEIEVVQGKAGKGQGLQADEERVQTVQGHQGAAKGKKHLPNACPKERQMQVPLVSQENVTSSEETHCEAEVEIQMVQRQKGKKAKKISGLQKAQEGAETLSKD